MDHPVVLITGALTGVGRATALAFAREGARVVISGRRDTAGAELSAELRALGAQAEYVLADVRLEADVSRLIDQVLARFGRLDIAINNAGTEGESAPLTEQSTANFETTFATNVLGTFGPVATQILERFTGGDAQAKAGFVATIPARRPATPEEIAQTILFVASDKVRYLTGQSVSVDGGYTTQ